MTNKVRVVRLEFDRKYKLVEHVCPICNTAFEGSRIAVYDRDQCRRKADWLKNGKRYNASRTRNKINGASE
jgi:hypothetical protein